MTHAVTLLKILSDGRWHANHEFVKAHMLRYGDVIFRLKRRGYLIDKKKSKTKKGVWYYRLNLLHFAKDKNIIDIIERTEVKKDCDLKVELGDVKQQQLF